MSGLVYVLIEHEEARCRREGRRHEVLLIGADCVETVRRTHRHLFRSTHAGRSVAMTGEAADSDPVVRGTASS